MSVVERLGYIVQNENISERAFDLSIGKKAGYYGTLKKNKSTPSADVVAAVHKAYPQYNLTWLLTGEGNWLDEDNILHEESAAYSKQASITINVVEGDENSALFKALEALIKKQIKK